MLRKISILWRSRRRGRGKENEEEEEKENEEEENDYIQWAKVQAIKLYTFRQR